MTKMIYILRGVSGSGKTTLANTLATSLPDAYTVAADDFFYEDGVYNWNAEHLSNAHSWCKTKVVKLMNEGVSNIVLHNTSTSLKELKPYLDMAKDFNYKVTSIIIEKRHEFDNEHEVPEHAIKRQSERLSNNIKLN